MPGGFYLRAGCSERGRRLDEISLYEINADFSQPIEIFLLFDLLGDNPKLHCSRQFDHRRHHLLIYLVGSKVSGVATVDLQVVNGQVLEI